MTKMIKQSLLIAGFCALSVVPAVSQEQVSNDDVLTMYAGEMKPLATTSPSRVMIGNPAVADVINVSNREILVAGKGAGMTNLLWWDGAGERSVKIKVLTEEMAYVQSRIDDLLKQMSVQTVYTKPADAEGRVLLLGSVKTQAELDKILSAVGELNKKVVNLIAVDEEEATVELEVEVLEVSQDGRRALGIQWPGTLNLTEADRYKKTLEATPNSLFHITKWTHPALTAQIDFLVQEGKARVLSRPKLACQSGKAAELLVGGEKPVLTTQISGNNSAAGTEVNYKEYGIKLKMAPLVTVDNKVKLSIGVEVSDVEDSPLTLGGSNNVTALAYPLTKRNTSTQLVMNDSQTLAISGLIKQKTVEQVRKWPILGDIPVVGLMFRHRDTQKGGNFGNLGDTELIVMVTPKILRNGQPVAAVTASMDRQTVSAAPQKSVLQNTEALVPAIALPVEPDGRNGTLEDYARQVTGLISSKLAYPPLAKKTGAEGTVRLALHMSASGELLDVAISKSSGSAVLDSDALSTSKEISPYPGFPQAISEKDIWIQVPIAYKLDK